MQEFESISASSYDPSALATKLTAKAAEGWSVVAIVPTGGDVTAFVTRDKGAADESTQSTQSAEMTEIVAIPMEEVAEPQVAAASEPERSSSSYEPAAETQQETQQETHRETQQEAVNEPSGWAIAPEPAATSSNATPEPTGVQPSIGTTAYQPSATPTYEPVSNVAAASTPTAPRSPDPAPAPAVPAGWYADPAGRFELRYWDGMTWTEHVSRAGQQFTDPPVA
ncbi:MAG TPA: DUF2510 domain-containing protein [Ilumatobacteraceae bacterium]|jgi:hypothetical protein